jgi:archaellum biogenesis ATPase FlaH
MNIEKQKLLLSYLISSQDLFWRVNSILDASYFDPQLKNASWFIKKYYDEYKNAPSKEQILAETSIALPILEAVNKEQLKYAEKEVETFCKNSAMTKVILAAPQLLAEQNFGAIEKSIKEAISIGVHTDIGLNYFENPESRLREAALNTNMYPTKIIDLDEALGGGLNRKELTMILAGSGVGKSIGMLNIGKNLAEQKLNVLYITLELAEKVVAKRKDSMISKIGQIDILKNISKVSVEITKQEKNSGDFMIKYMSPSTTNANHIRSYLKEYESIKGFLPDVIIVDYLDLMASVEKISVENVNIKDKYVSEELRSIASDVDCIMISASQLNRSGAAAKAGELGQGGIAGGFTKIFTADNVVAIIQDELMKAAGEYLIKLLKTRSSNGVGKFFIVDIDPVSLLISNKSDSRGPSYFSRVNESASRNKSSFEEYERGLPKPSDTIEIKTDTAKPIDQLLSRFKV